MTEPSELPGPIRPRRPITGISAVLLPFDDEGAIDWPSFRALLARTVEAGLVPAVNMDTGYVNLLTTQQQVDVLAATTEVMDGRWFVAGAFVSDVAGASFDLTAYQRALERIEAAGGTPVIFPSFGLTARSGAALVEAYEQISASCERFIAFELGAMFAPFGRIYEVDDVLALMDIPNCIGIKHSSLDRVKEWERLRARDLKRPDFSIFTGNDLAIDMVMYGSDYLLGLSAFAPDHFAQRDRFWAAGDPRFYELNDVLQYLGAFAFRAPVPAYKHTAAQVLKLRGWIPYDATHPDATRRPDTDREILRSLLERLDQAARG